MYQQGERAEKLATAREQLVQVVNRLSVGVVQNWGLSDDQVRIAIEHLKLAIAEIDAAPRDEAQV
jgi:ribosome maturation protein Sdo1